MSALMIVNCHLAGPPVYIGVDFSQPIFSEDDIIVKCVKYMCLDCPDPAVYIYKQVYAP